jgi:glycosyltransferase involved in cell wall biosynthesis
VARVIHDLMSNMDPRICSVRLMTSTPGMDPDERLARICVRFPGVTTSFRSRCSNIRRVLWVFLHLLRVPEECWNFHFVDQAALAVVSAATVRPQVRLVCSFHGNDIEGVYASGSRLHRWAVLRLVRRAQVITAPSKTLGERIQETVALPAGSVTVIPNGVDQREFRYVASDDRPARLPTVLVVARLETKKGVDRLIKAWARTDRLVNVHLIVAGTGSQEATLKAEGAALHVQTTWLGEVSRDALPALYHSATCVCIPSVAEPFGIVLLEALASGVPVVTSGVDGLAEIIATNPECAVVVPHTELPSALAELIDNPHRQERLREAGEQVAQSFTIGRMVAAYKKVLSRCNT